MHEIHLDTIDSTNTYAKLHASTFPANQITCISAEEQTAGRGRYERHWASPRGVNLYATFCFRLPAHALHLTALAQVMAASLTSILQEAGLRPKIKWPNDVLLQDKKVSGILCETVFQGTEVDVFLGIGINVNMEEEALHKIDQPATSLKNETGQTWDKKALLGLLQRKFSLDLDRFKKEGFAPFHNQFENLLAYKGEQISCFDGKKEWIGICHSLTAEGMLNLYLEDHTIQALASGDIKNFRRKF